MNYNDSYLPVAQSKELGNNQLIRVVFNGAHVVLGRPTGGKVVAFEDKCPHRGAMLSQGRLVNGELECPYHGWRFDMEGENTMVPVKDAKANCRLAPFIVAEQFGLIWLTTSATAILPLLCTQKCHAALSGAIAAKPANILENFLEGSHTHYVHNGWVRTQNKKRQRIEAKLQPTSNGFQVTYQQEPAKGLLTKLVPARHRQLRAVSTYIYPFCAVLEYFNEGNESVFRVEMILSTEGAITRYHARVYLKIGWVSHLAVALAKPLLARVIRQDKDILEQQERNLGDQPFRFFSDETDTVGKQIFAWLHGKERGTEIQPFTVWW